MDEREIEAVARASSALDEVVAYFDDGHRLPPAGFPLASVVRPAAEGLRAALDRVRDARGDEEIEPYPIGHPDVNPTRRPSPQDEDHEAYKRANERLEAALLHIINRVSTEGRDDEHKHLFLVGSEAIRHARAEIAAVPSRVGSVAVEDVERTVYVAGRTFDIERVRRVQQMFRDVGYRVTFDWTGPDGEIRPDWGGIASERGAVLSRRELEAVRGAAITVLLWKDPTDNRQGMVGALIESGAALANGRQLWVVGPSRDSVFFHHTNARVFEDESGLSCAVRALAEFSRSSTDDHRHEWVDARNELVESGEVCVGCGAVRASTNRPEQPEPDVLGGRPPAEPDDGGDTENG
jgi:hypothetical protein